MVCSFAFQMIWKLLVITILWLLMYSVFLRKIQEEFQKRCGALKCRDLKAITDGKALCPCEDCVRNAVMIYGEFIGI